MPRWPLTFWERMDRSGGSDGCWPWTGERVSKPGYGYGILKVNGRNITAHRRAYELAVGPIPTGLLVRHSCDNPPCCNPTHLLVGTQRQNLEDMVARGRFVRPRAKVNVDQVREIRARDSAGETHSSIAAAYGLSPAGVGAITRRENWKQVS